ncbi:MAG: hypothetical protein K0S65_274 [Labilithrix sp.]|nr:hypothetical protein [Labilithrix sp.]
MGGTTRFPRLERYVSRLPNGLDAYSDCRCRASVYRIFIEQLDLASFPFDEAPAPVRALLQTPFLHNMWLPEAHVMATIHAVADFLGFDDVATLRWMDESNGRLLNSRMYRALMRLASPSILLALASRQWGILHRGTKLAVERGNPVRLQIDYPEFLYDELIIRGTATGIRHALALSRANDPSIEIEEYSPTRTTYRVRWT